jgi:hypothetical protein
VTLPGPPVRRPDRLHALPVGVDQQLAAIALECLDPLRPLRDGLTALGLDHRVAIRPIHTRGRQFDEPFRALGKHGLIIWSMR